MNNRKLKTLASSLAALAVLSVTACTAPGGGTNDQVEKGTNGTGRSSAVTGAVPERPIMKATSIVKSPKREKKPGGAQADKATQVHMEFTNNSHQVLTLIQATRGGDTAHWQTQPPTTLQPGDVGKASSYAAADATLNLVYQTSSGALFALYAKTPLLGDNSATGSTDSTSYTVLAFAGSGYNPTNRYEMNPGHTFTPTGQPQTFTVPEGVTAVVVGAVGGAGGISADPDAPSGAQIVGTLTVTPGETLTIGVGGTGQDSTNNAGGGWGMSVDDSSYSGGKGRPTTNGTGTGGGGGASVVLDGDGNIVVVAGGAGGEGGFCNDAPGYHGGQGGAGGSLTGGAGDPGPGKGGAPGANSAPQGQDAGLDITCAGGAGGGGVAGGLAGVAGTGGGGGGGGAGSSSVGQLTGASTTSAPKSGGDGTPGSVTFTALS